MIKNRLIVLLFLFITNFTFAQQYSVEVTKKEGRFITHLDANKQDINYYKDKSGLVKSIKLGIEWWSSMGVPIEKYLIKWERGTSVKSFKHNYSITKNELVKYPDLLKRYKYLKPIKIDLEFSVVFNFDNQEDFVKDIPKCMKSTQSLGASYYFIGGTRKLSSKTNYLIEVAGVNGDDLVPTSPKTWTDFISYDCDSDNATTKAIFLNSKKAKFMLLEVLKIEVPTIEIDAIVGEYLKREKGQKKNNDWGDLKKENSSVNKNDWNLDKEKNTNDSWATNTKNNNSNGWGETTTKESIKYEIKYKEGKYGVVDESGNILIPYKDWRIIDYKPEDKMARVSIKISSKEITVHCEKNGSVYIYLTKEGYVGKNGNWIIKPENVANIGGGYRGWSGLTITTADSDCDYDCLQEKKRKWKARDKKCISKVNSEENRYKEQYRQQGYKIK